MNHPWWNSDIDNASKKCFIPSIFIKMENFNRGSWFNHIHGRDHIPKSIRSKRTRKIKFTSYSNQDFDKTLKIIDYNISRKRKRKRRNNNNDNFKGKKRKIINNVVLRTCKTRIFPTSKQKTLLRKWFGTSRFLYNKTIHKINKNYRKYKKKVKERKKKRKKEKKMKYLQKFDLIKKFMGKNCKHIKKNPWLKDTPSHIRANSIIDAIKARNTSFELLKTKKIKRFKLKFRSKRYNHGNSMVIPKTSIKNDGTFYKRFLKTSFRISKQAKLAQSLLSNGVEYDCRIKVDRLGRYYIIIPYNIKIENQDFYKRKEFVALDPGIRTFQSYYSPDGIFGEFGKGDINRIRRLTEHMDNLQSKTKLERNGKKRYRMKRAWYRMIDKIKNLVNELHKKCAKYLTDNFNNILLPTFETKNMTNKLTRNISSKTARSLLSFCHYRFKERLAHVCKKKNVKLYIVTEEYTSKTCGICGKLHPNLKHNEEKLFECPFCKSIIDRDINAARNIFLKYSSFALSGLQM